MFPIQVWSLGKSRLPIIFLAVCFFVHKVDSLLFVVKNTMIIVFVIPGSTASDQIHSAKGENTSSDKLPKSFCRCRLEVSVQHGAANDDRDRETNKLGRNDLSGVESLQSPVDVPYLCKGRGDEDEYQEVGDGERESSKKGIGDQ